MDVKKVELITRATLMVLADSQCTYREGAAVATSLFVTLHIGNLDRDVANFDAVRANLKSFADYLEDVAATETPDALRALIEERTKAFVFKHTPAPVAG